MRRAYTNQRSRAKGRGIAFEFTFEQWKAWWLTNDRWSLRGRHKNNLVMARPGDTGPYSPDNVFCITQYENLKISIPLDKRQAAAKASGNRAWANYDAHRMRMRRGATHPRSRPIRTQVGVFANATLAAKAFEISRQHAARLAREKLEGWEYI